MALPNLAADKRQAVLLRLHDRPRASADPCSSLDIVGVDNEDHCREVRLGAVARARKVVLLHLHVPHTGHHNLAAVVSARLGRPLCAGRSQKVDHELFETYS